MAGSLPRAVPLAAQSLSDVNGWHVCRCLASSTGFPSASCLNCIAPSCSPLQYGEERAIATPKALNALNTDRQRRVDGGCFDAGGCASLPCQQPRRHLRRLHIALRLLTQQLEGCIGNDRLLERFPRVGTPPSARPLVGLVYQRAPWGCNWQLQFHMAVCLGKQRAICDIIRRYWPL